LELLAQSHCTFIAFSPESGSPRLLEVMNKPFDHEHGLNMLSKMNSLGIRTQACFVLGIPGENDEDRTLTVDYVKKLVSKGVDEVALYIFTPLPGAVLSEQVQGYSHYSQCTRSPSWRDDYESIHHFRMKLYFLYFMRKLMHPKKIFRELCSFITGRFETKMEMSIYKQIKLYLLRYYPRLYKQLNPDETLKVLDQIHLKKEQQEAMCSHASI